MVHNETLNVFHETLHNYHLCCVDVCAPLSLSDNSKYRVKKKWLSTEFNVGSRHFCGSFKKIIWIRLDKAIQKT